MNSRESARKSVLGLFCFVFSLLTFIADFSSADAASITIPAPKAFYYDYNSLNLSSSLFSSSSFELNKIGGGASSDIVMSLQPMPSLKMTTSGNSVNSTWGDVSGLIYYFAVLSNISATADIDISYESSILTSGNMLGSVALLRYGEGVTNSIYTTATDISRVSLNQNGSSFDTGPSVYNATINTNTLYHMILTASAMHGAGSSFSNIYIDPVIAIVTNPNTPNDFILLEHALVGNSPVAATPEPGTMLLMGIGAAGAAFMRRRAKRA